MTFRNSKSLSQLLLGGDCAYSNHRLQERSARQAGKNKSNLRQRVLFSKIANTDTHRHDCRRRPVLDAGNCAKHPNSRLFYIRLLPSLCRARQKFLAFCKNAVIMLIKSATS